mmetsp:Transcript_5344/g.13018  ORF Transcript_5344/g.13018 Transcript_5344/m.13018 type:complete len:233 (-) Transcript_5344:77-775(-)
MGFEVLCKIMAVRGFLQQNLQVLDLALAPRSCARPLFCSPVPLGGRLGVDEASELCLRHGGLRRHSPGLQLCELRLGNLLTKVPRRRQWGRWKLRRHRPQPLVFEAPLRRGPLLWPEIQELQYEVPCSGRHRRGHLILRQREAAAEDRVLDLIVGLPVKRPFAGEEGIQDAAERPHVDRHAVALVLDNLGGHVRGRSARRRSLPLRAVVDAREVVIDDRHAHGAVLIPYEDV